MGSDQAPGQVTHGVNCGARAKLGAHRAVCGARRWCVVYSPRREWAVMQ